MLPLEQFQHNFGVYPVPQVLEALLAFQNASPDWYSWGFELSLITREDLMAHVMEKEISQFLGFGHDGSYSIYALWMHQDIPLEKAPVVYFNAEGEGSGVIANNLMEFFTLLACDEEPRFGIYMSKAGNKTRHSKRNQEFRDWIAQKYHLYPSAQPNELVQHARKLYPELPLLY